jgi:hypothetical protein
MLGPDVTFQRTAYDAQVAARRIRQSSWPGAEEFAARNVIAVPTEAEAMEFFAKAGGP